MPTLILSARQTEDAQQLWRACIAENWQVIRAHGWRVPEVAPEEVAIYGEPLFAEHVAQTLGLRLQQPSLDWLPKLPYRWRCRDVCLTTLGEARKVSKPAFIKPADEKCFEARVYSSGAQLPALGPLPEELPVLVQEVVAWTVEYRCFIRERKVMTASVYWRNGQLAQSPEGEWTASDMELNEATRFCDCVISDSSITMPTAVVIDVGLIRDHGWAVVESNAAYSAGLYGCDPVAVLSVLRHACQPIQKN